MLDIISVRTGLSVIVSTMCVSYLFLYIHRHILLYNAPVNKDRTQSDYNSHLSTLIPLIASIPMPIFILNQKDIILHANKEAHNLLHFMWQNNHTDTIHVTEKTHGKAIYQFIRNPDIIEAIRQARSFEQPQQGRFYEMYPTERHFNFNVIPVKLSGKNGKDISIVYFSELTKEKMIQRSRSEFVANASHELRTPLTIIKGNLETLIGNIKLNPSEQKHFIEVSLAQSKRMENLIQDLLVLSRIELAEHIAPCHQIDIISLLEKTIDMFLPLANQKQFTIVKEFTSNPIMIMGVTDEISQIYINILDNALKYGANPNNTDNKIIIAVDSSSDTTITITFTDYGEGIDTYDIPKITERFFRTQAAKDMKNITGTGLGLAIVKHIVNKHNGEMTIKSTKTAGTSVCLTFSTLSTKHNGI